MWNDMFSILKYVCKEKLLFLVSLPNSFSTWKNKQHFSSFGDQIIFFRLNSKKVLPGNVAWVIS